VARPGDAGRAGAAPLTAPRGPRPGARGVGCYGAPVVGGVIIVIVMLLVIPVGVMFGGAVWSALFGWMESRDAADRAAGGTEG
jgi:hypothetical protein